MFRVGAELVARLPRRTLGAQILVHEQRWLPLLAPRLPLPIPYPERIGHPAHGYPWPWSIVPYLPGEPAATADRLDLPLAAAAIAGFLGAMHVPAPADAPPNPFRGVPLAERAENFGKNDLNTLAGQVDRAAVLAVWEDALAAPVFAGPPVWLHGDMHPANILVRDGLVSGIIDFGDITAGDPAADLSVAWMLLPIELHGAFRDAYQAAGAPAADDALWRRARGWALNLALAFLAHSADNPLIHGIGDRTLRAVLAPDP
jgi:aminoglycoside phosphotransferase (APT) family kinase protein